MVIRIHHGSPPSPKQTSSAPTRCEPYVQRRAVNHSLAKRQSLQRCKGYEWCLVILSNAKNLSPCCNIAISRSDAMPRVEKKIVIVYSANNSVRTSFSITTQKEVCRLKTTTLCLAQQNYLTKEITLQCLL